MKNIIKHLTITGMLFFSVVLLNSCKKFAGLAKYEDFKYEKHILDPQQSITAWEYLNKPRTDTIFNQMIRAIKYAGLEAEYQKPDRTYIFLSNAALGLRNTSGVESTNSYFGKKKVGSPAVAAKKFEDYPVAQIKDLLLYHIIQGRYTYGNLEEDPTVTTSLRTDPATNKVTINIQSGTSSSAGYALQFNNFVGSAKTQNARTANLQMTQNCVVHVLDSYMSLTEP